MSGANLPPLKTRKLGRTNVRVTELGLGTAPLGELFDKVEDDEAAAIIGAAWDGGVRYFDTSPWYGRGSPSIRSAVRSTASRAINISSRPRSAASSGARSAPTPSRINGSAASSFRPSSTTATTA